MNNVDERIYKAARVVLELHDTDLRMVQSIKRKQHYAMKHGDVHCWSLAPSTCATLKSKAINIHNLQASLTELTDAISINEVYKAIGF